jgi:hypothetical protein
MATSEPTIHLSFQIFKLRRFKTRGRGDGDDKKPEREDGGLTVSLNELYDVQESWRNRYELFDLRDEGGGDRAKSGKNYDSDEDECLFFTVDEETNVYFCKEMIERLESVKTIMDDRIVFSECCGPSDRKKVTERFKKNVSGALESKVLLNCHFLCSSFDDAVSSIKKGNDFSASKRPTAAIKKPVVKKMTVEQKEGWDEYLRTVTGLSPSAPFFEEDGGEEHDDDEYEYSGNAPEEEDDESEEEQIPRKVAPPSKKRLNPVMPSMNKGRYKERWPRSLEKPPPKKGVEKTRYKNHSSESTSFTKDSSKKRDTDGDDVEKTNQMTKKLDSFLLTKYVSGKSISFFECFTYVRLLKLNSTIKGSRRWPFSWGGPYLRSFNHVFDYFVVTYNLATLNHILALKMKKTADLIHTRRWDVSPNRGQPLCVVFPDDLGSEKFANDYADAFLDGLNYSKHLGRAPDWVDPKTVLIRSGNLSWIEWSDFSFSDLCDRFESSKSKQRRAAQQLVAPSVQGEQSVLGKLVDFVKESPDAIASAYYDNLFTDKLLDAEECVLKNKGSFYMPEKTKSFLKQSVLNSSPDDHHQKCGTEECKAFIEHLDCAYSHFGLSKTYFEDLLDFSCVLERCACSSVSVFDDLVLFEKNAGSEEEEEETNDSRIPGDHLGTSVMESCQSAVQKMTALFGLCFISYEKDGDDDEEYEEYDEEYLLTLCKIERLKKRTQLIYALSQLEVSHALQRVSCVTNSYGMCALDKIKYSAACRHKNDFLPTDSKPKNVNNACLEMYKSKLLGVSRNAEELASLRDDYVQRNYSTLYALYLLFCSCFSLEGVGNQLACPIYDVNDLYDVVCKIGGGSGAMRSPVKPPHYSGVTFELAAKRGINEIEMGFKIDKMKNTAKTAVYLDEDYYHFTLVAEKLPQQDPATSSIARDDAKKFDFQFFKNFVSASKPDFLSNPEAGSADTSTTTVPGTDEETEGGSPRPQQQDDCATRSRNQQFLKRHPTKDCIEKMLCLPVPILRLLFSGLYRPCDSPSTPTYPENGESNLGTVSDSCKKCRSDLCHVSFWLDLLIPLMNRSYGKPNQNAAIINFLKKNRSFFSNDSLVSFSVACRTLKSELVPGCRSLFEYVAEQTNYVQLLHLDYATYSSLNTFNVSRWAKCVNSFYSVSNSWISYVCKSIFGSPGSDGDVLVWDSVKTENSSYSDDSLIFSSPEEKAKLPRSKSLPGVVLKRAYFSKEDRPTVVRVTFSGVDTNQTGSFEDDPGVMSSFRLKSKLLLTSILHHVCVIKANVVRLNSIYPDPSPSFSNKDVVRPENSCSNHPLEQIYPINKLSSDLEKKDWCFQHVDRFLDKFLSNHRNAKMWLMIFASHSQNTQSFNPTKLDYFTPNFLLLSFKNRERKTDYSHGDVCCYDVVKKAAATSNPGSATRPAETSSLTLSTSETDDLSNERIYGKRMELLDKRHDSEDSFKLCSTISTFSSVWANQKSVYESVQRNRSSFVGAISYSSSSRTSATKRVSENRTKVSEPARANSKTSTPIARRVHSRTYSETTTTTSRPDSFEKTIEDGDDDDFVEEERRGLTFKKVTFDGKQAIKIEITPSDEGPMDPKTCLLVSLMFFKYKDRFVIVSKSDRPVSRHKTLGYSIVHPNSVGKQFHRSKRLDVSSKLDAIPWIRDQNVFVYKAYLGMKTLGSFYGKMESERHSAELIWMKTASGRAGTACGCFLCQLCDSKSNSNSTVLLFSLVKE